jgi:hypothetical protein
MEFEMDDAPALELLLTMVEPIWICVQDFIHDDTKEKNGDCTDTLRQRNIVHFTNAETK